MFDALPVLVVVLALVAMIMLHELGHFATAKWSGMKVTEYFLGFGPRLWSIRRGETEYGVKAIPAGGYVRIVGMTMLEEVDPSDEARSYRQASFPRRLLVAFAGSGMHVIIAFVLLFSLYAFSGAPTATSPTISSLGQFSKGLSPAQRAGLRPGDVIVAVDGHKVTGLDSLITFVNKHPGDALSFVVDRDGHDLTLRVTPVDGRHVVEEIGGQRVQAANPSGPPKGRHRRRAHQRAERVGRPVHRGRPCRLGARFHVRPDLQRAGPGLLPARARAISPTRSPWPATAKPPGSSGSVRDGLRGRDDPVHRRGRPDRRPSGQARRRRAACTCSPRSTCSSAS